jgi:hypothetical protein
MTTQYTPGPPPAPAPEPSRGRQHIAVKLAAIFAVAIVAMVAIDSFSDTPVPEATPPVTEPASTVPQTTAPETTVPRTTVPRTTVPRTTVPRTTVPRTTVATYSFYDYAICDTIDAGGVSSFIPDDWDDWCNGIYFASKVYDGYTADEKREICSTFWSTRDSVLIDKAMDGGISRDEAIGMVDWLWTTC